MKLFFCLVLLIVKVSCYGQFLREIPLKHSSSTFNESTTNAPKVQVFVKFDSIQFASDAGLKFSLRLKNNTSDTVVIINPIDFLNITLLDSTGRNRLIPYISKVYLRNTEAFTGYPFSGGTPMLNGELLKDKVFEMTHFVIPAKSSYEVFFNIKSAIRNNAKTPHSPSDIVNLEAGTYNLVIASTIAKDITSSTTFFVSQLLIKYLTCK